MTPENIAFLADQDNVLRLAHWIIQRTVIIDGKLELVPAQGDQFDGLIDEHLYAQLDELCAHAPPPPPNQFTAAVMAYQLDPKAHRFAEVVRLGQAQGMSLETIYARITE